MLAGSIKDWPELLKQCYQWLRPNGKVEIAEIRTNFWCGDDTFPKDSAVQIWLDKLIQYFSQEGIELDVIPKVQSWLEEAGFTSVKTLQYPIPVGTWPKDPALKERGALFRLHQDRAFEAYALAVFTRVGGWSYPAFQVLIAKARQELWTNRMHIFTYA